MYEDDQEFADCELCAPPDGTDAYPYAHCCGCGADGGSYMPDCLCN